MTVTVAELTDAVSVAKVRVGSAEVLWLIDDSVTVPVLFLLAAALSDEELVSKIVGSDLALSAAFELVTELVELADIAMVQEVATPFPSSWYVTGWVTVGVQTRFRKF